MSVKNANLYDSIWKEKEFFLRKQKRWDFLKILNEGNSNLYENVIQDLFEYYVSSKAENNFKFCENLLFHYEKKIFWKISYTENLIFYHMMKALFWVFPQKWHFLRFNTLSWNFWCISLCENRILSLTLDPFYNDSNGLSIFRILISAASLSIGKFSTLILSCRLCYSLTLTEFYFIRKNI